MIFMIIFEMRKLLIAAVAAFILLHPSSEAFHWLKTWSKRIDFTMHSTYPSPSVNAEKRIVFIRHGCTFMNEHLSKPGCSWGSPNFSDIFPEKISEERYRDSKLSPLGLEQAKSLAKRIQDGASDFSFSEVELFVVSPLTRAIETYKLGILPVVKNMSSQPPTMALPLAAERVYLISDIGHPRSILEKDYGDLIDFRSAFKRNSGTLEETWWFDQRLRAETYKEWRPTGENQRYACPGEPDSDFEKRMRSLYKWLCGRKESTIAVICHWGVINWMLDADFENCEYRVVDFDDIRPPSMENLLAEE